LQAGRHARAARPQALDDRLPVDGMAEGLADARIGELRMVLVEHRQAVVDDGAAQHLELGILLDARDLVGRHVADEVELARQQAVDA
jgi:hypothetical protein